jgi:autotransporter translocation and assembly factor TamB
MARKHPALRKLLRISLRILVGLPVFALALLALAFVSVNVGPLKQLARSRINQALASSFSGTLIVDRIGSIQPLGVSGIDLHVLDARAHRVLVVKGLDVKSSWPRALLDVAHKRPLAITLEPVHCDHIEVQLIDDGSGSPTLASVFSPRKPAAPSTEPSTTTIAIPDIRVAHVWAHGGLPSLPVIDVEAKQLVVSVLSRPELLRLELKRLQLLTRALPARVDPSGKLSARVELPANKQKPPSGALDFDGKLLDSAAKLRAKLERDRVEAHFDMPALKAEPVRELSPSLALSGPSALKVEVHGELPELDLILKLENAAMKLDVQGQAQLKATKRASLKGELIRADLSQLSTGAPPSNLNLRLTASATLDEHSAMRGEYRLKMLPSSLRGVAVPNTETFGVVTRDAESNLRVNGELLFDDPGVVGDMAYYLRSNPSNNQSVLQTKLTARLSNPARAKKFLGIGARGTLSAQAELDLAHQRLEAETNLDLRDFSANSVRASTLSVKGTATGVLSAPELDASALAKGLALDTRRFATARVTAKGTPQRLRVDALLERNETSSVHLNAVVALGAATKLSGLQLAVRTKDGTVDTRIASVELQDGAARISGLELSGAGNLTAKGLVASNRADLEFALQDLDLGRLNRVLELGGPMQRGFVSGKGKIKGSLRKLRGELEAHARDLDFESVRGGQVDLSLAVGDSVVSGTVEAKLGRSQFMGEIRDLRIPTLPATRAALLKTRGTLTLKGNLELDRLAPALRAAGAPLEQGRGEMQIDFKVDNPDALPNGPTVALRMKTSGLKLVEQRPKSDSIETASTARATQPTAIQGLDTELELSVDSRTREARLQGSLFDRQGVLARLEAETQLANLASPDLEAAFGDQQMKIRLSVPERSLEQLPDLIRPKALRGRFKAELSAEGTPRKPRIDAAIQVARLKARKDQRGIDAKLQLQSTLEGGKISGSAQSKGSTVAELDSKWQGNLAALARAQAPGRSPVLLDAELRLTEFPVGIVPALSDRAIHGPLNAELRLEQLGRDGKLRMRVDGRGLSVSNRRFKQLDVSLDADDRAVSAKLLASESDGTLQLDASAPMDWGARLVPVVDPRAKAHLSARGFQISTLSPLLLQYVSEIEGNLDADLGVELTDAAPRVQGKAQLRRGVVQVPQIGQRFSDISADVAVADGDISLESLKARGVSGRLSANARAALRGSELQSVKGHLEIKKDEKLPLTFEGVAIGDAWGRIDLAYMRSQDNTDIRVDVPDFHVQMPDAPLANVQDLALDEHVKVGVYRDDGKFAAVPIQPLASSAKDEDDKQTQTRVRIHLGSVWIERALQVKAQLGGDLTMTSGDPPRVDGEINLRGGKLDVNGKTFDIESGTVAFSGTDTSDPTITATARWDSPAGYTVYADYSGTVKAGKLTLHSEPQLTQTEIVSLLLFGTPEGSLGATDNGGGATATAVGVAGDTATKGFNRVMSDFTNLDVSARIDTSTGSARPELVVQVTPRLTTRVTRAVGEPSPGQSPDRTFLTLELRLQRAWALSAIVGDRGASSLDLIWRRRY